MTATKTSAPTKEKATPRRGSSGRNGTAHASSSPKPKVEPREPSTNGKQSTKPSANPNCLPSAAAPFSLRTALRLYVADLPDRLSRDEATAGFVKSLDADQREQALYQAVRISLPTYLGKFGRDVGTTTHSDASGNRSSKWDAIRASHEDGSLSAFRRIVDIRKQDSGGLLRRFGLFGLGDLEWMVETRKQQARGNLLEAKLYQDIAAEMKRQGGTCVDDLAPEWLVERWNR